MKVQRPTDLPEVRLWLAKQWLPGQLFSEVERVMREERLVTGLPTNEWAAFEATFDLASLETAGLYWVSSEMAALIDKASRTLPPTTLTPELVPAPTGLIWFEDMLRGHTAHALEEYGETIWVRSILWGTSMIPPGPHPALGIAMYAEWNSHLSPAGRTDWEWGSDSDAPIDARIKDDQQRVDSMAEDRRWLATFFLLLSQTGIATSSTVRAQPRVIRKVKRVLPGLSHDVRVIDVHKPVVPVESSGEGRQVEWSHRWTVGLETGGFWRQQAYGPNHSLRRPQFIAPFIKGPADKPLKIKDTVHVLKDGQL